MQQKDTQFKPTPNMLKLLEAAINPDVAPNFSAWCKESNVARSQWYRWQKQTGFLEWFNNEYSRSLEGARAALVKVGLQKALSGDFQFWKVMVEKLNEYNPKIQADLNHKVEADCHEIMVQSYETGEVVQIHHCCANKDHEQKIIWKKNDDVKGKALISKD
ncbi:MAG: hypothetical protein ABIA04_00440 [Pseudomonadota bacterium]